MGTTDDGCLNRVKLFPFAISPGMEWNATLATNDNSMDVSIILLGTLCRLQTERAHAVVPFLNSPVVVTFPDTPTRLGCSVQELEIYSHTFCGGSCLWLRLPSRSDLQWPRPLLLYGSACAGVWRVVRPHRLFPLFCLSFVSTDQEEGGEDDCVWQRDSSSNRTH